MGVNIRLEVKQDVLNKKRTQDTYIRFLSETQNQHGIRRFPSTCSLESRRRLNIKACDTIMKLCLVLATWWGQDKIRRVEGEG